MFPTINEYFAGYPMVFRGAKLHFFFHTTIQFCQKKCIFPKNMLYNIFFYLFNWKKSSNFAAVKKTFSLKRRFEVIRGISFALCWKFFLLVPLLFANQKISKFSNILMLQWCIFIPMQHVVRCGGTRTLLLYATPYTTLLIYII